MSMVEVMQSLERYERLAEIRDQLLRRCVVEPKPHLEKRLEKVRDAIDKDLEVALESLFEKGRDR